MKEAAKTLGRWTVSAGVLAVLGFGASQALASPPDARTGSPVCNTGQCNVSCKATGAQSGRCVDDQCVCLFVTP